MSERKMLLKRIAPYVGVMSILVAMTSLWYQARSMDPELTITIDSVERLYPPGTPSSLKLEATYKGKSLSNVWSINSTWMNTGRVALVASGQRSNMLDEGIRLSLQENATILSIEALQDDIGATLSTIDSKTLEVRFGQWMVGEVIRVRTYVTLMTDEELELFGTNWRGLVNGRINLHRSNSDNSERPLLRGRVHPVVIKSIALAAAAVGGVMSIAAVLMLFVVASEAQKYKRWHRDHFSAFKAHIEGLNGVPANQKDELFKSPWEYKGPLPNTLIAVPVDDPLSETMGGLFRAEAFVLAFLIAGLAVLALAVDAGAFT